MKEKENRNVKEKKPLNTHYSSISFLFACYQILALGNQVLISSILLFSIYTYSNLLSVCTYNLITRYVFH
eukprot:UN4890